MLIGSPDRKNSSGAVFKFTCHVNQDLYSGDINSDNFNFNRDCPYGIRIEARFPSCWDGLNLYKEDMSHMAYPIDNAIDLSQGECFWTHPIKVPQIILEYTYHTSAWAPGKSVHGNLAWSNGDSTGYGVHADFVNG